MATAKVQVLVTLNGAGVWRVVAPLDPKFIRRLTADELKEMETAIPDLIGEVMNRAPKPNRKAK